MGFGELLSRAQVGEQAAFDEILSMYQPLLVKMSVIDRRLDKDVYQELSLVLLKCVRKFQIKD